MYSREKNIILFHPQTSRNPEIATIPLELLAISRYFDSSYNITIIDGELNSNYEKEIAERSKNALCIGISSMTGCQIHQALKAAYAARRSNPQIKVIWGGWHPSVEPKQTISHPLVDIIVKGQGDVVFKEIVDALVDEKDLSTINGITLQRDGEIIDNPQNPLCDISKFPRLPFHLLDLEKYVRHSRMGLRNLHYYSSQGCPFKCTFCADSMVNKRRWVANSPEQFISDISYLKERFDIDSCTVVDSNFFINIKRVREICKLLIDKRLGVNFGNLNGRASQLKKVSRDDWELFNAAGFKEIFIGAESALQESLDFIQKGIAAEDILTVAEAIKDLDIRMTFSFMMGLPRDEQFITTKKHLHKELNSAIALTDKIFTINANSTAWYFIYTPYPGTPLFHLSIKKGFQKPGTLEEWQTLDLLQDKVPWIPKEFTKKIAFLTGFVFYYMLQSRFEYNVRSTKNPVKRFLYLLFFKSTNFRWKKKFFYLRIDYWIKNLYETCIPIYMRLKNIIKH
jgi:radical SAM superfamily enzyme YgiQ (UPF0313 family)